MDADTIRTYAEIGTAIGTLLLAFVTFGLVLETRNQNKENIKVEISKGKDRRLISFSDKGVPQYENNAPKYAITAINKGYRSVTIRDIEIWVENTENLSHLNWLPETYGFEKGESVYHFLPFDLKPGDYLPCKIFQIDISRALTYRKYSREIRLTARYISATNHTFKSDPFWHKIES